jgi:hypothetical protein
LSSNKVHLGCRTGQYAAADFAKLRDRDFGGNRTDRERPRSGRELYFLLVCCHLRSLLRGSDRLTRPYVRHQGLEPRTR